MSILDELTAVRDKFESKDRQDAIRVMTWLFHYEVPFRIGDSDTFLLFRTENDINSFCMNNDLKVPAMKLLLAEMNAEGLIAYEGQSVILTPLGVEKLCRR